MWRSSSLSSSSTTSADNPCQYPKTIDQVWNDVTIPPPAGSSPRVILQDFFSKEPPPAARPPPLLTLNSAHEDHFLLNPYAHQPLVNIPFDAMVSDGGGMKRSSDSDRCSGDGRNKRMMKNRVSAARSRARKQAYTNELELQVAHLRRQNASLRKQQEQLLAAAGGEHQEKKSLLHRTSSAPF